MKKEKDPNEFSKTSEFEPYDRAALTHKRVALTDEMKELVFGKLTRLFARFGKLESKRPHRKDFAKNSDYKKARDEYNYKINRVGARIHLYDLLLVGADPNIPELKKLARHLNVRLDKNLWTEN